MQPPVVIITNRVMVEVHETDELQCPLLPLGKSVIYANKHALDVRFAHVVAVPRCLAHRTSAKLRAAQPDQLDDPAAEQAVKLTISHSGQVAGEDIGMVRENPGKHRPGRRAISYGPVQEHQRLRRDLIFGDWFNTGHVREKITT